MRGLSLVLKEIAWRKLNFALAALAAAVAVGVLVGSTGLLSAYDAHTRRILADKAAEEKKGLDKLEDDYRKITLKLGFNVLILPKDQKLADLYADDFAAKTMPEDYAQRLARSKVMTINHMLPILEQKVKWTEQARTILLVGTRGEVPVFAGDKRPPLLSPVGAGTIVLGSELWQPLALKPGDNVTLLGRSFKVSKTNAERGTKDDITAWIFLPEAQALLDKPGVINAIMAISCECEGPRLATIRKEIERALPDTQVIEFASQAVTRAEARERAHEHADETLAAAAKEREALRAGREKLIAILVPVSILGAAAWIAILAFQNVRDRRSEIGILRALGMRSAGIIGVFLTRSALTGLLGAAAGIAAGLTVAGAPVRVPFATLAIILAVAPALAAFASWPPAVLAARQDPALILGEP